MLLQVNVYREDTADLKCEEFSFYVRILQDKQLTISETHIHGI